MENVRTRDFIYTTDDLFFASTNYVHPENRFISFLRYIPNPKGDREKENKKYSKVNSEEAYKFLKENHPEYLYFCDVTNVEMMGVPHYKVKKIIKPEKRLSELREAYNKGKKLKNPEIMDRLMDISDFFHYIAKIPYENLGISGSILPGLHKENISDIDFVVFGLENHRKAMDAFRKHKNSKVYIKELDKTIQLNKIEDNFWERLYNKRMKDSSLSKKEFCWYEKRKNNRGTVNGTLFDILATRNYNEISGTWGDTVYEPLGISQIECTITNAIGAYDNPSVYEIDNLKVINGVDVNISEIASYTHTYAGQAIEHEEILAKGKVEKVIKEDSDDKYRLVVGTTRESIDEYIKLKEIPI